MFESVIALGPSSLKMKMLETCLIDGHWGQYGIARMVVIATELGMPDDSEWGEYSAIFLARLHLASMGPSTEEFTADQYERLMDRADEVEEWMNKNVAPEGYSFGWHDGEFFLWSAETRAE